MAEIDRLNALCEQTRLTGIDFIQVVEPLVQTRLRVFFVVEPDALDVPIIGGLAAPDPGDPLGSAGPPIDAAGFPISIAPATGEVDVTITGQAWRIVNAPAGQRIALEITVAAPGDFGLYELTLGDDRVDPFFNRREFSFKQGCPSVFDCREDCTPEPIESVDYPVDYLARDFWSLRRALLDFAAERYPQWSEPLEADQAVMLMEIMAALGDEFAYTQDRYAREAALATATQRRSRSSLSRLVDHVPDPGVAAETELALWRDAGGAASPAGARAWAWLEGAPAIPYTSTADVWIHAAWNAIDLHCPDSDVACLPKGATEAYLVTDAPLAEQLPEGEELSPEAFWVGRRMILRWIPSDPAEPYRAFPLTIVGVEKIIDSLAPTPGTDTEITCIRWETPTPWPMLLSETQALGNIVPVRAGEEVTERFRIGPNETLAARFPALAPPALAKLLELPRAIEREGPCEQDGSSRGRILRFGLRASETRGLGWIKPDGTSAITGDRTRMPLISLQEIEPVVLNPVLFPDGLTEDAQLPYQEDAQGAAWTFERDILASDQGRTDYTLEEGLWREVMRHPRPLASDLVFEDYASDLGWSLRFGDGAFGRPPEDGALFEVRYTTAPGTAANLAPDSVTELTPPGGASGPGDFGAIAESVTNPLTIASGRAEEDPEDIRISAPEAFRALPLRAVRPEDFSEILARLDWVQRANATTRWTGSWGTYFVAADPVGGFAPTTEQMTELGKEIDCIRQVTRDARATEPDYVDIDLEIKICVAATAYPGEVAERVTEALAAPGYFSTENFTFGQSLFRSGLEAAIQRVPGVKGVEGIRIRERRKKDWREFLQPELGVEPWQILRLQNDARHPGRGSIAIKAHGGAA